MAILEKKYMVDLEYVGSTNMLSNHGILSLLENIGCVHSNNVGLGINQIEQTHLTWVLLHWKVKIFKRVCYNSMVTVKTWARACNRFSTLRDFEIYDEDGNLLCIASSKWALIDIKQNGITKITDDILNLYECEEKSVFNETDIAKLKQPILNDTPNFTFKVLRRDIDVNEHMHNLYYLDYAYETLPENVYSLGEANEFEIMYKTGAKLGNTVCSFYTKEDNSHFVIMKSEDGNSLNAIIKFVF